MHRFKRDRSLFDKTQHPRLVDSRGGEIVCGHIPDPVGLGLYRCVDQPAEVDRRLVERATRSNSRFDRRSTWLDAETFLALRTEHERGGRLVMRAEVHEVTDVQGVPTPAKIAFRRFDSDRTVELVVRSVDYEAEIPESYFSAMALISARLKLESR